MDTCFSMSPDFKQYTDFDAQDNPGVYSHLITVCVCRLRGLKHGTHQTVTLDFLKFADKYKQ